MSKTFFAPLGIISGYLSYQHIVNNPILQQSATANEALATFAMLSVVFISLLMILEGE